MSVTELMLYALYITILLVADHGRCATGYSVAITDHGRCTMGHSIENTANGQCVLGHSAQSSGNGQCGHVIGSSEHGHCAMGHNLQVIDIVLQDPRFVAVKRGWNISIECRYKDALGNSSFSWYLRQPNGSLVRHLPDHHISVQKNYLIINNVQRQDSGIYFCRFSTSQGEQVSPCGTELMVVECGNHATAKSRNTMKDAIIMIQTILIVLFVVVPVTILMEMKKKRTLKIEDHLYEGLEAYQTATYEDIQNVRVLAAKTMEAEHPCLE